MAISYTITQDGETVSYTIQEGVGPAGPNNITTSTGTAISGILKGDGSTVSAAVAGTDYSAPGHTHLSADVTDATTDGSANAEKLLKTDASGNVKANKVTGKSVVAGDNATTGQIDIVTGGFYNRLYPNATGNREVYMPDANGYLPLTAQTDGTIRATDLDFANTTDIGADLADADEVLVSDGGGNTTRRKSALSRFKTYIQALTDTLYVGLTGNQTVAGNKTFSGQLEATGQAATNSTSLMTRGLGDTRYGSEFFAAYKSANTSRNTTTTPTADPDIAFASVPVGVYRVELSIQVFDNSACGFQWQFGGTATFACLGRIRGHTLPSSATSIWGNLNVSNPADSLAPWGNATRTPLYWFLLNVTVAGTVEFQWAQHTSSATNATLYAGSYCTMKKIN